MRLCAHKFMVMLIVLAACGGDAAPVRTPTPRPRVCSTLSVGCACGTTIVGDGTQSCDVTTVVSQPDQRGFCCQTEFVCQCRVRECVAVAELGYCLCGNPQDPTGAVRVHDCNNAMPGLTCCRNSFGCMCGSNACADPSESVPNCSIADVTTCDLADESIDSCT